MPVVQDLADMYKAVDAAATVNLLAKLAVEKSYHAKLDDTRSSLAVYPFHPFSLQLCISALFGTAAVCPDSYVAAMASVNLHGHGSGFSMFHTVLLSVVEKNRDALPLCRAALLTGAQNPGNLRQSRHRAACANLRC